MIIIAIQKHSDTHNTNGTRNRDCNRNFNINSDSKSYRVIE